MLLSKLFGKSPMGNHELIAIVAMGPMFADDLCHTFPLSFLLEWCRAIRTRLKF